MTIRAQTKKVLRRLPLTWDNCTLQSSNWHMIFVNMRENFRDMQCMWTVGFTLIQHQWNVTTRPNIYKAAAVSSKHSLSLRFWRNENNPRQVDPGWKSSEQLWRWAHQKS